MKEFRETLRSFFPKAVIIFCWLICFLCIYIFAVQQQWFVCVCSSLQLIRARSGLILLSSVLVYYKQATSGLTASRTADFSKKSFGLHHCCPLTCLSASLIPLSWSQLAQMISTQPQRLPQNLMGLSSLISDTC